MSNPNIINVSSIYGQTSVLTLSTSATAIATNSSGSNSVLKINSLNISNTSGSASSVTVDLYRSGVAYLITNSITIAANSSLVVITKDTGLYLLEGDTLRVSSSINSTLQAVCAYEVIS